jgi:hypothetical protein
MMTMMAMEIAPPTMRHNHEPPMPSEPNLSMLVIHLLSMAPLYHAAARAAAAFRFFARWE